MEKGLNLAVSFRGQAQGVLGNQDTGLGRTIRSSCKLCRIDLLRPTKTELYRAQLRERHQKASDTLPEMGQEIQRFSNLAYPTASSELKEVLATEQFLDGLFDPEMRLKIKQARPVNLNDAIQRAVELEAFNRVEKRRKENVCIIDKVSSEKESKMETLLAEMQKSISELQQELKSLKKGQFSGQRRDGGDRNPEYGNRDRKCYNC